MPPKRGGRAESESDDDMMMGGMDGMAALGRFTNTNFSKEFMKGLPESTRTRAEAVYGLESGYDDRVKTLNAAKAELQRKYEALYAPILARRREIVTGEGEAVTEAEVTKGYPEEHKGEVEITGETKDAAKGLPNFWLRALTHHCIIEDMVTERDAEVLENLVDVRTTQNAADEPQGFALQFYFAPNEYFEEEMLEKKFFLKEDFGENVISGTKETKITWKSEEQNVTVMTVTKKQKSKSKGATRTVTRTEPCESFFNLFTEADETEEAEQWYSLGETLRSKIIPLAVEYFTGEAPDGSSDIDEDEEDEDYDDEEDEDDEDDMPMAGRGRGGRGAAAGGARGGRGGQDCKQQ